MFHPAVPLPLDIGKRKIAAVMNIRSSLKNFLLLVSILKVMTDSSHYENMVEVVTTRTVVVAVSFLQIHQFQFEPRLPRRIPVAPLLASSQIYHALSQIGHIPPMCYWLYARYPKHWEAVP